MSGSQRAPEVMAWNLLIFSQRVRFQELGVCLRARVVLSFGSYLMVSGWICMVYHNIESHGLVKSFHISTWLDFWVP